MTIVMTVLTIFHTIKSSLYNQKEKKREHHHPLSNPKLGAPTRGKLARTLKHASGLATE